jgi:hypothetical protein
METSGHGLCFFNDHFEQFLVKYWDKGQLYFTLSKSIPLQEPHTLVTALHTESSMRTDQVPKPGPFPTSALLTEHSKPLTPHVDFKPIIQSK